MSAERGGAAVQDRPQHLQVQPGKPLLTALEEALSGCADHIGHLEGWPRHLLCTAAVGALGAEEQSVERAGCSVQMLLGKVEVDGGLFQIAMAQQNLNRP